MASVAGRVDVVEPPSWFDDPANQVAIEEWVASVERGDSDHAAAVEELVRRWEAKGWRIVPGEQPGDPPRGVRIGETESR